MAAPRHYYGLLTADDLAFEPDDGLRREIYDGVLHVVAPASGDHAWSARALDIALSENAPDDVHLLQNVGVHAGPHRYFVPDLTVLQRTTPHHRYGYDPGGVLLVVEVVSPGSIAVDRSTKPPIYAEIGIPYFWRIDDGPRLQSFRLDPRSGEYVLEVELGPGDHGNPAAPWPVTINTANLVMPHKR